MPKIYSNSVRLICDTIRKFAEMPVLLQRWACTYVYTLISIRKPYATYTYANLLHYEYGCLKGIYGVFMVYALGMWLINNVFNYIIKGYVT